ncbi:unnamed protein product [Caenorhabditis angaria]|uniref:Uncharacterized protein n=1 Tax=Caenorhabditis angaria TaxID=860376 RepID=A0A9P1IKG8_9PELO|nr:unnamed protein product [Caenorhabditis angaria]
MSNLPANPPIPMAEFAARPPGEVPEPAALVPPQPQPSTSAPQPQPTTSTTKPESKSKKPQIPKINVEHPNFASTVNQYALIECFASIESTLASEKLESADLRLLSSKNRSNDFVKLTFQ